MGGVAERVATAAATGCQGLPVAATAAGTVSGVVEAKVAGVVVAGAGAEEDAGLAEGVTEEEG